MTMSGSKSQRAIITVETETGNVAKVVDENGNKATKLTPEELHKIYESQEGLKYVGTILHSHSSPGCIYIIIGGWAFKICF